MVTSDTLISARMASITSSALQDKVRGEEKGGEKREEVKGGEKRRKGEREARRKGERKEGGGMRDEG